MSSNRPPQPNTGLILQGDRVVGGVNLPEPADDFLREFNARYGHLGIRVERNFQTATVGTSPCDHHD
jgi:hypothetical protein